MVSSGSQKLNEFSVVKGEDNVSNLDFSKFFVGFWVFTLFIFEYNVKKFLNVSFNIFFEAVSKRNPVGLIFRVDIIVPIIKRLRFNF